MYKPSICSGRSWLMLKRCKFDILTFTSEGIFRRKSPATNRCPRCLETSTNDQNCNGSS